MRTLYLRNVPDDVVHRLEQLAASAGMSVSSLAVAELAAASRRADNPALLAALPDVAIPSETITVDLDSERSGR